MQIPSAYHRAPTSFLSFSFQHLANLFNFYHMSYKLSHCHSSPFTFLNYTLWLVWIYACVDLPFSKQSRTDNCWAHTGDTRSFSFIYLPIWGEICRNLICLRFLSFWQMRLTFRNEVKSCVSWTKGTISLISFSQKMLKVLTKWAINIQIITKNCKG